MRALVVALFFSWFEAVVPQPGHVVSEAVFLEAGVPFVGGWEGKRNCAYFDIVGVPTIGYGHTRTVTADDVRNGLCWSDEKVDQMLGDELLEYREGIHGYFTTDTLRHRLPVGRDVAYTSLAFNVGIAGAGRSTATRRLNAGDIAGGCQALTWFNRAGGRVVRGLVNRRTEEYGLCVQGL